MSVTQINLDGWQDYRGDSAGVLLYVETSKQAVLPVRDQLNENGKGHFTEPNYETASYNLVGCFNARSINSIVNNKHRYILFGTRYQGVEAEYTGKFLVHGYMRIDKIKDTRPVHVRRYMLHGGDAEPECMHMNKSWGLWSSDIKFFSLADCFELTEEVMKNWGYKGRITKQMKLLLDGEKLEDILNWFADKADITEEYIRTAQEFSEIIEEEEEDVEVADDEDDEW
jgi:hypothetical protein